MALQSSGQITLDDIRTELGLSQSNVSLGSMSDTAGKSDPDQMSDFYGYSHATITSFSSSKNPQTFIGTACNQSVSVTRYHNGSGTYPAVGDTIYTDSAGTINPANGYYRTAFAYYYVGSGGSVTSIGPCL